MNPVLRKFKHTQSIVLILFFAAWMLQSISPLGMHFMTMAGSHSEAMACSIDGECNSASCSVTGHATCSCKHASADKSNENRVTLCGCSHHGNEAVGTASSFQIKAPLAGARGNIILSSQIFHSYPDQSPSFIFMDDIFHPPRPGA